MTLKYNVIEIFTSEETKYKSIPLYKAVVEKIHDLKIAARCIVSRGIAGCYENGEIATHGIEILSFNMPLKIEIVFPSTELNDILSAIEVMVTDGIMLVEDMNIRCHKTKANLIPRQLRVRDVMTKNPRVIAPSNTLKDAVALLLSSDFNGIPVTDAEMRPAGMITQGDLILKGGMPVRHCLLSEFGNEALKGVLEALEKKTVAEIMSAPAVTVNQDLPLTETVDLMLSRKLKRLPVVDAAGKICGVLARLDIFRTIVHETPEWRQIKHEKLTINSMSHVRDVMRRDIHEVLPETSVEDVIKVIDENDIQRVAVVDSDKRLVGMISDTILLSAFSENKSGLWEYLVQKFPAGGKHKKFVEAMKYKTAGDIMKKDLLTISENAGIDEAIRIMAERGIKRLPVIDNEGRFRGMLSRDSLLRQGLFSEKPEK